MSESKSGVVLWFDSKKGYGFAKPDDGSADIFIHFSDIAVEGYKTLQKDQKISYEVGTNKRGQPKAVNVVAVK